MPVSGYALGPGEYSAHSYGQMELAAPERQAHHAEAMQLAA